MSEVKPDKAFTAALLAMAERAAHWRADFEPDADEPMTDSQAAMYWTEVVESLRRL